MSSRRGRRLGCANILRVSQGQEDQGKVGDGRLVVSGGDGGGRSAKGTWGGERELVQFMRWGHVPNRFSKVNLLSNTGYELETLLKNLVLIYDPSPDLAQRRPARIRTRFLDPARQRSAHAARFFTGDQASSSDIQASSVQRSRSSVRTEPLLALVRADRAWAGHRDRYADKQCKARCKYTNTFPRRLRAYLTT